MIRSLSLKNFKAFETFRVSFNGDAYLVGPNNAGKSTVIAALRSVANMVRMASRAQPSQSFEIDGFQQTGYWFTSTQIDLVDENLQHEFHQVETRLKAKFDSGATLEAVWPVGEEGGFFFVLDKNDINLMRLNSIREVLPTVGVVPVLAPADHSEELLSEKHVRENLDGRLASRHFRNQLYLLKAEPAKALGARLDEFKAFAEPWITELELEDLNLRRGDGKTSFDLNYREPGSRIPKEIFWTGDGMQIWLQLLLHIFRLQDRDVVVLDEPDVFLHSDLQRRLVNLLENVEAQTITATHSAEVIGEAPGEAVIWVSRKRKRAVKAPSRDVLSDLSATLGTQFNLPLAKALKTKVVVFVEGQDAKILRNIGKTLDCEKVVQEDGVAIIPLGGFDRWVHVAPFQWLMTEFLEDAVTVHVILDRDYRSQEAVQKIRRELRELGVKPHIWKRNEIENYLLAPRTLARLSGATEGWIQEALDQCADELEAEFYAEIFSDVAQESKGGGKSAKTLGQEAKERADAAWADSGRRLSLCSGKDLLRLLNKHLQHGGMRSVTARGLAARIERREIAKEVKSLLASIENDAS